jgi:hypothetical protein
MNGGELRINFYCKQLAVQLFFCAHLLYMWARGPVWQVISHKLLASRRCPNNVFGRQINCHCQTDDRVPSDSAPWPFIPHVSQHQRAAALDSSILRTCLYGVDKCLDSYSHKRMICLYRQDMLSQNTPTATSQIVKRFGKEYISDVIRV